MSRRGSAVNSQANQTTNTFVKSTFTGISAAAGDVFVGIIFTNSGSVTLNSLLGGNTAGHDWSAAVLSPAGALPKAGDSMAGNIECWLVVRQLTAQDISDGFVQANLSASGRCGFTAAVWTGGTGTWQTPPAVQKATASTLTGPTLVTVGINSDVVEVSAARNATLSTFPVISLGTGFTTDNTDGTTNATSANLGGATGHLTTPVAAGTSVGGQSISATNTPTQIVAYLVELDPITAKTLTDTGSGADAIAVAVAVTLADTGSGLETIAVNATVLLTDTGSATETFTVAATITLADTGSGADAISVNMGSTPVSLSDSGSGNDTFAVTAAVPLADTGSGADQLQANATVTLADTGSGADALQANATVPLADTGQGADAITVQAAVPLTDTGHGSDQLQANAAVTLVDTGTGIDAIVVQPSVPLSDTGHGTDGIVIAATITLAELGQASEAFAVQALINLADTGASSDAIAVVTNVPATPGRMSGVTTSVPAMTGTTATAGMTGSTASGGMTGATASGGMVGATSGGSKMTGGVLT